MGNQANDQGYFLGKWSGSGADFDLNYSARTSHHEMGVLLTWYNDGRDRLSVPCQVEDLVIL